MDLPLPAISRLARLIEGPPALVLLAVVCLLPPAVLVTMMLSSSVTTFTVEAMSEAVEVEVGKQVVPRWALSGALLQVDGKEPVQVDEPIQVQVEPESSLRFQRIGRGPLLVVVEGEKEGRVATVFDLEDRELAVADEDLALQVVLSPEGVVLLPLVGDAHIGQIVHSQTHGVTPILRSARVRLLASRLGSRFFGSGRYQAGATSLEAGDRFHVLSNDGSEGEGGSGFIRVDDASGFEVLFRVEGEKGVVTRFGSPGYHISPSLWVKLTSDPGLQTLIALVGSLSPLVLFFLNAAISRAASPTPAAAAPIPEEEDDE